MITNKKGDVLTSSCNVIGHQVNCLKVMGGGLALQIKNKYPEVFNTYVTFCDLVTNSFSLLGKCLFVPIDNNKFIANLFGQHRYNATIRMTNYEAIYQAMESCEEQMRNNNLKSIAFPYKMSSGLAGGNWNIIRVMIEDVFKDYEVEIWEYV
jgi:O-acetyl-ADP-ribose deacetylase (regulator of RNase III)